MELYYNLLGVYSPKKTDLGTVKEKAEDLMGSSYLENSDLIELAIETNSVLFVEEEQEDGDMRFVVINNKGKVKAEEEFCMDESYKARDEIENSSPEEYFTSKVLKDIDKLAEEYEMSREEFIEDYLSTYYMDIYENKKQIVKEKLEGYYQE